jgi:hypothetical protein
MLGIIELLSSRGLDANARVKLVRHQGDCHDFDELDRKGLLELYQSYQSKPVFTKCDYIVSFIGMENSRARFYGVYQVCGHVPARERPLPKGFEYPRFAPADGYFYILEKLPKFDDLKGRMVIDWGGSPLAWHQWLTSKDKEVIEVLPAGYVREFPGYLDFVLSFDELAEIVRNPAANREWHRMLSAVAGVYLIVDAKTGKQYVGSACGERGILARWSDYAASGHGGNKQLMDLLISSSDYARNFQFTILQTLPRTLTKTEVAVQEALYKKKLGSRAFGLNCN